MAERFPAGKSPCRSNLAAVHTFMRRRRFLLPAVIALMWLVVWVRPGEPRYGGRPITAWLNDRKVSNYYGLTDKGAHAIAQMGSNAVPYLLRALRREDAPLDKKLVEFLEKIGDKPPFRLAWQDYAPAADGLAALGPSAVSAIPELSAMLNDQARVHYAANALAGMGGPAITILTNALATNASFRPMIIRAFHRLGTNLPLALPALMGFLQDSDHKVVRITADVLAMSTNPPEMFLPALTDCLSHPAPQVRSRVLAALAQYQQPGTNILAQVLERFDDPVCYVQSAAMCATYRLRKDAESFLISRLNDPEPRVRQTTAMALEWGGHRSTNSFNALTNLLADDNEAVRKQAAKSLKSIDRMRATRMKIP
jgi:HEAT repeat protein